MKSRELKIERIIKASPVRIFRCWTTPELMEKWFCPKPWYVSDVVLDLRAGGASSMFICGPNGEKFPNNGVYLDVVPNKRIVFTDAFTSAWIPSDKAFFVGTIELEDLGDGTTKYTAVANHWTKEGAAEHEKMGFFDGWNAAADQLEELCQTLQD